MQPTAITGTSSVLVPSLIVLMINVTSFVKLDATGFAGKKDVQYVSGNTKSLRKTVNPYIIVT
jgi:hypothetical protein